ncbi:TPA: AAA family ATPase [Candidatus Woesearchaeota archaeon]|nr:DNA repair and recombination protein RadB [archaeon GW2011_AR15]MBS3103783.1 AAA family ATPase [Candidatus Woesearchaeota archaeon]HIH41472.1 AAA family ATPase [Candidatus Woesearchaeota archaeon]
MAYTVSPNTDVIGKLIGDYESGKITMVYGNSASGKTTLCLLAAISAAEKGKVIFVDAEKGFNPERLKQLYGKDIGKLLDNIFLIQPKSFREQHDTILKVKKICSGEKIKLVVVDTVGHYYRNVLNETPKEVNEAMAELMANLIRIARDYDKVVLLTNPVYARMDSPDGIKMVGGSLMERMCKVIVELHRKDDKRTATLKKYKRDDESEHPNIGKEISFEIRENGLFSLEH